MCNRVRRTLPPPIGGAHALWRGARRRAAAPARVHSALAPRWPAHSWQPRIVICATPFWGAGCGSSTTCTARAAGDFAVGARPAGAALAPSAASSSMPPTRRRALYEVHVCMLPGMFRAHVTNLATRSHAERAYFSPPHSRRSPRRSPPCSARHRRTQAHRLTREPMRAIHRPITNRSLSAPQTPTSLGGALSLYITATTSHHNNHDGTSWLIETTRNCLRHLRPQR